MFVYIHIVIRRCIHSTVCYLLFDNIIYWPYENIRLTLNESAMQTTNRYIIWQELSIILEKEK